MGRFGVSIINILVAVIIFTECFEYSTAHQDPYSGGPEFFDSSELAVYPVNAKITKWFPFRAALACFGLFVVPVLSLIFWVLAAPVISL